MTEQLTEERARQLKNVSYESIARIMKDGMAMADRIDAKVGGSRLHDYLVHVSDSRNAHLHNLYEVLAVERFYAFAEKYSMKVSEVAKFVLFFESLPIPGEKGRSYAVASGVQLFQFANIYGWHTDEGLRLTHDVLLFVPRKYGKTTVCGGIALFDAMFGDYDAESYLSANSFKQATICYNGINKLARILDGGRGRFHCTRDTIEVRIPGRESRIQCLTNSPTKLDGLKASACINDELSQADSFEQKNVITTSMGVRRNPLTVDITTASSLTESPFVEELENYKRILRHEIEDDSVFASLFLPDIGDDEGSEQTWQKVNPHIGVTVRMDFYRSNWKKAIRSYEDLVSFRTKLLNVFVYGDQATWIRPDTIYPLMADSWREGDDVYAVCAIDLSVKDDFSAVTYMSYDEDEQLFRSKTDFYFPDGCLETHPNAELYKIWARDGHLRLVPGNVISYRMIADDILSMNEKCTILKIGYDPYKDSELINDLRAAGAGTALSSVGQTRSHFTAACGQMEILIDHGGIQFDRNPIVPWCFGNCVMDEDGVGNRKPVKKTRNLKIDGAITNLMCVKLWAEIKK